MDQILYVFKLVVISGLCYVALSGSLYAQPAGTKDTASAQVVEYPASFFDRYRPNTALDMVMQLPGFQLDDGTDNRGFAAAVGNILINDRRLSAKQDLPSATLARIPASQVERIQLVHGQDGGIDLQGQSVVANIYLRQEDESKVSWKSYIEHNNRASIKPAGSISISNNWSDIDYNAGIDLERNTSGYFGREQQFDGAGTPTIRGGESSTETGYQINGITLNAASMIGATSTHLNTKFSMIDSLYLRPSYRNDLLTGTTDNVLIRTGRLSDRFELGVDAERMLSPGLVGKVIFLLTNNNQDESSTRTNTSSLLGQTLLRLADTDTQARERITRLEFDYSGANNHVIQLNLEGAYNVLDRSLLQTDNRGVGPLTVVVPGANSRVQELRGDFLLDDTWMLGRFELAYGMGMEISEVTQSGDAEQKRNFHFFKPHGSLTYSSDQDEQMRVRLSREVSQLTLTDFVSATVFEDDDLALGNPDLRPETTWAAELGYERRFDAISVIKVTTFYNWISGVLDLLPLSADFEAPGNIGDGRRWGMEFEGTAPLEWTGLQDAKLNLRMRWQDSTVEDPVTGIDRILSGENGQTAYRTLTSRNRNNRYFIGLDYRQDLEAERVAWGWTVAERDKRPLYRVNELDVYHEDVAMDAFIESTRWFDLKIRFDAINITDDKQERDRTVYSGLRDLSPTDFRLLNYRQLGRRLVLSVSGNF